MKDDLDIRNALGLIRYHLNHSTFVKRSNVQLHQMKKYRAKNIVTNWRDNISPFVVNTTSKVEQHVISV